MDLGRDESRFARQSRPRSSSRKFGAVDKVGCHMLPVNFAGLRLRTGSEGDLQWEQIVKGRRLEYLVMAADKQHAHELIERLAPSQVPAAIGMLERLLDPVSARSRTRRLTTNRSRRKKKKLSRNRANGSSITREFRTNRCWLNWGSRRKRSTTIKNRAREDRLDSANRLLTKVSRMNINLRPEQEQMINDELRSGHF